MARLIDLARKALATARERKLSLITAESCTAGKLAALLSQAPGAAEHLQGGFVTYTKANKTKSLGVPAALLKQKGAVRREVAVAMAKGALARSPADIAVSITGVAGPDPDEDGNPVGRVCIAVVRGRSVIALEKRYRDKGRTAICRRAMTDALRVLLQAIGRRATHSRKR
jgi:nicotinamide-nucleotide amidase